MNGYVVAYLTSIDEQLLFYLDDDNEMMFDTVERLRYSTSALLAGSTTPAALNREWPDWFILVPAFVLAYGTEELKNLQDDAGFLRAPDDGGLAESDRAYLRVLALRLDEYPEIRTTTQK
jgi:hypothetical protein